MTTCRQFQRVHVEDTRVCAPEGQSWTSERCEVDSGGDAFPSNKPSSYIFDSSKLLILYSKLVVHRSGEVKEAGNQ